jgi:hypothetical protein
MNAAYQNRAFLFGYNAITVPPIALPAGDNLALTATDWATSSDFSAAFDGSKAIDGVIAPDSKWTSDGSTSTSWLALDLGQLSGITGAVVRSAGAGYETPIYNLTALQIQVGPSLSGPWTTHFTFSDNHPRNRAVCLFDEPVFARFVRLLVTDAGVDNYARVPEFEVYGIAWTGPPPSGLSLD